MRILKTIKNWLLVIRNIPSIIRALRNFGPDPARMISQDMLSKDVCEEVFINWIRETSLLLPRQYEYILRRLFEEELLSAEKFQVHVRFASMAILDSAQTFGFDGNHVREIEVPPFPWVEDPDILHRVSQSLKERIKNFENDCRTARKSEAGIMHILKFGRRKNRKGGEGNG